MKLVFAALSISLLATACGPGARESIDANGGGSDGNGGGGGDGGGGGGGDECTADGVDLIYVVDLNNKLSSFNPRKLTSGGDPFTEIGTLNCPTQLDPIGDAPSATPFSMSVDRSGFAWVLYNTGEVFRVDIKTAQCTASGYQARQMNYLLFGMGFVTDSAGADTEKLFLGGGDDNAQPGGKLARVDTSANPPSLTILGNLRSDTEQSPELTGTSEAKLYGFYPGSTKAFVQEMDRTTGAAVGPELKIPGGLGGNATAWAFAFWGGKFYIFVTTESGLGARNSTVRVIDRATGVASTALMNLPRQYVGAGVSTCAPVVIE